MRAATLSKTTSTDRPPADGHGHEDLFSSTARLPTLSWVGSYLIVVLAIWALVGRYRGITHDAALYMLQSVARLTPDPLAQDIFLRFESQDRFTIFSSGGAWVIALLGPDRAAALLTFVFLLGWYALAWALAALALVAITVGLALPRWSAPWTAERLADALQDKYGYTRPNAESQSIRWMHDHQGVPAGNA